LITVLFRTSRMLFGTFIYRFISDHPLQVVLIKISELLDSLRVFKLSKTKIQSVSLIFAFGTATVVGS
jgi:hypothetical protein